MKIHVYKILKVNRTIETLLEQHISYPINVGYKIFQLKKELDNIEKYIIERLSMLCPNFFTNDMTEEEKIIYETILSSEIELNNINITIEEITNNNEVKTTLEDIENLMLLFNEKNEINS